MSAPAPGPPSAPPPPSTSGQVAAHRFALRRAASALVRRDPVPAQDPLRTHGRATLAGVLVAALALGVAAVWGLVDRPADWRTATVVVGAGSGALYVVAHAPDRLVPVPNVVSARLVAAALDTGTAGTADPVEVADAELAAAPRTPPVGIDDAPPLPPPGTPVPALWSVCDTALADPGSATPWSRPRVTTAVVAAEAPPGRPLAPGEGLLLRDRFGGLWLVHDGLRSRIDAGRSAVVAAFGLGGVTPRPATTSLLNALPEGPAIGQPALAGRGAPVAVDLAGEPVGGVVRLVGPGVGDRWFVLERAGVQEVPPLVAALVRLSDPDPGRAARPIPAVRPDRLALLPPAREIDVTVYPEPAPRPVPLPDAPTTCTSSSGTSAATVLTVSATAPPPGTVLRQADGSGDRVDSASLPGTGLLVRGVPPGRPDAPGALAVVSGSGTVSAVPDAATAAVLGLVPSATPDGPPAVPVPETVLGLLPAGPVLAPAAVRGPPAG